MGDWGVEVCAGIIMCIRDFSSGATQIHTVIYVTCLHTHYFV